MPELFKEFEDDLDGDSSSHSDETYDGDETAVGNETPDSGTTVASDEDTSARDPRAEVLISQILNEHEPVETLEKLGISEKTLRDFRVTEYLKGSHIETHHANGDPGQPLFRFRDVRRHGFEWVKKPGLEPPIAFNTVRVNAYLSRNKSAGVHMQVWIVEGVIGTMLMHQNGFLAQGIYDVDEGHEAVAEELKAIGATNVVIAFDNDVSGRNGALKMRRACLDQGIKAVVRSFIGKLGHGVSDEFKVTEFDLPQFARRMRALPMVDDATLQEWADNPEAGLPEEHKLYELATTRDLHDEPSPGFVVDGLLSKESLIMLSGRQSSGKSIVLLDMALSVASGRAWHGHEVEAGPVLYLAGEGGPELGKRIAAWKQAHGLDDVANFYLLREAIAFHRPAVQRRLMASLLRQHKRFSLIVVDTLASVSAGLSENSSENMSVFMRAAQNLSRATGASIIIAHHHTKASNEYRGSSVLAASVDTHIQASAYGGVMIYLEVQKQKEGELNKPLILQTRQVEMQDCNGKSVTSLVCELSSKETCTLALLLPNEQTVLQALINITPETTATNPDDTTQASAMPVAGATIVEWGKASRAMGVPDATFIRARRKLSSVNAVYSEHPGARGARYVVLPAWRRLLIASASQLEPNASNEVTSGDADDSGVKQAD